ncbi:serine hydrolase domain-containing protein [Brevibacillus daliensis]|uniref:serine hydrolase domain-containing protein n=1 Tax=Brevibacillus daliensis TaxID=2892995 RepID=UPI001E646F0B|nr:serine hydrolase domain-containing protein [Brevibacillus daliensis]
MNKQNWEVAYEEYVAKVIEDSKVPGVAVGLAKDGELAYGQGFGYRNIDEMLEVTIDTVFGIGSITKSFTCMAIMQLHEAGKLSVNDCVTTYLPEFRLKNGSSIATMTIHQLMTHSTGMPPLPTLFPAMKKSMDLDAESNSEAQSTNELATNVAIETYDEMLDYLAELDFQMLGEPGTEFSYSNDSYALLGIIVERVSGQVYETYIKEHILEPAGMTDTSFFLDELEGKEITSIYESKEKEGNKEVSLSVNWWDAPAMRAAGFIKSTVRDMLKYADIYRSGGLAGDVRILSEGGIKQMITPHIQCEPGCHYGYGLMIIPDYHGTVLIEHGGSIKGAQAQMYIVPDQGLTGIVLTNMAGSPATALMKGACNAYAGRPLTAKHIPIEEYELPEDRIQEFTGDFLSSEGMQVSIVVKDDKLQLVTEDTLSCEMIPVGEDLFMVERRGSEALVRFIRDSNANIIRIGCGFRQIPKVVKPSSVSLS